MEQFQRKSLAWEGWGFAAWMSLLGIGGCVFMSFGLGYFIGAPNHWIMSGDVWATTGSAQYVGFGGLGFVYSANPWYSALPGFLILYAPIAVLGFHLGLVGNDPVTLARPSMWLLTGPFFFACGSTLVLGVDYLTATLGILRRRRRVIAAAVAVLVVAPTSGLAGHPEDLLAMTLVCLSFALLFRGRPGGAAVALSAAILMQTWAGLLLLIFVAARPPGLRLRAFVQASVAPAVMGVLLLLVDFKDASLDLLGQPMPNTGQHLPWWRIARAMTVEENGIKMHVVSGSSTRILAVVASVGLAYLVLRRPNVHTILCAASLALYARGFFETEYWAYYLAPAAVFLAVLVCYSTSDSPKRWAAGSVAAFLLYSSAPLASFGVRYSDYLALSVLLATGAICIGASFMGSGHPLDQQTGEAWGTDCPSARLEATV